MKTAAWKICFVPGPGAIFTAKDFTSCRCPSVKRLDPKYLDYFREEDMKNMFSF
jgi:hypothetical protein